MKNNSSDAISRLISEFSRLPGVGGKTAQRYAYAVINMPEDDVVTFAKAMVEVKRKVKHCSVCGNLTESDPCSICLSRDRSIVCVVEYPKDVLSFERVKGFKGVYHILHGTINPLESKGPNDINLKSLIDRVSADNVKEVILATNTTVEGEATAVYIAKLLKTLGIKTTRLAQGLAAGCELEYADEVTLSQALANRKEI